MFLAFRKAAPVPVAQPQLAEIEAAHELERTVAEIGAHATSLGRGAAEVRGIIDDTNKMATEQAQAIATLSGQVNEVTAAQRAIGERTDASQQAVARARTAVANVGSEVGVIVDTLRQV